MNDYIMQDSKTNEKPEKKVPAKDPHKNNKAYDLSPFRILVVEDYPFMADLISSMLKEFGVGSIVQAISLDEAKEILILFNANAGQGTEQNMAIDIVVTDWLMPKGNGDELLKWIRGHRKSEIHFLPTIVCSAYASEDIVGEARDHGANESLVKPVSAEKLAKRLLHVIDHPRPFIKSSSFFGPDRRRKVAHFDGENKRLKSAEEIKEVHERL